ncbi:MAG: hypothetical protein MK132_17565 [Lentisphaerales bacterium]|nr:hypothetical protein [Lentisphaerales bacterium]
MDISTEPYFVNLRQVLICLLALIYFEEEVDLSEYKPASFAWTLANPR